MSETSPTTSTEQNDHPCRLNTGTSSRTALQACAVLGGVLLTKHAFAEGIDSTVADVLNFALTLEYLEDEFYRVGLSTRGLIPSSDRAIFTQISKHEAAHVALLQTVLGDQAVAKPTFDFTANGAFDTFGNYTTFKALAQGFEDAGVRAYKGQATNLMGSPDVLTAALQIHSVEARHASEVRRLRGQKGWISFANIDLPALASVYAGEENVTQGGVSLADTAPATEAFDEPLPREAVLAIARLFIKG